MRAWKMQTARIWRSPVCDDEIRDILQADQESSHANNPAPNHVNHDHIQPLRTCHRPLRTFAAWPSGNGGRTAVVERKNRSHAERR